MWQIWPRIQENHCWSWLKIWKMFLQAKDRAGLVSRLNMSSRESRGDAPHTSFWVLRWLWEIQWDSPGGCHDPWPKDLKNREKGLACTGPSKLYAWQLPSNLGNPTHQQYGPMQGLALPIAHVKITAVLFCSGWDLLQSVGGEMKGTLSARLSSRIY